jgi:hypothetical protein
MLMGQALPPLHPEGKAKTEHLNDIEENFHARITKQYGNFPTCAVIGDFTNIRRTPGIALVHQIESNE